jgi:hypothetical protein
MVIGSGYTVPMVARNGSGTAGRSELKADLPLLTFTGSGLGIAGISQVAKSGPATVRSSHIAGSRPTAIGSTIA